MDSNEKQKRLEQLEKDFLGIQIQQEQSSNHKISHNNNYNNYNNYNNNTATNNTNANMNTQQNQNLYSISKSHSHSTSHSFDEDNAEIATFVDATIQDISNDGHLDLDDDSFDQDDDHLGSAKRGNNSKSGKSRGRTRTYSGNHVSDNDIHNDTMDDGEFEYYHDNDHHPMKTNDRFDDNFESNTNINAHTYTNPSTPSKDNPTTSATNLASPNKSTDMVLSALLEDDDENLKMTKSEMDYFYNQRKRDLRKELEVEKERSKRNLERLAANLKAGKSEDSQDNGYEGNGVGLGKVEDYIGKLKVDGYDDVTLMHGDHDDRDDSDYDEEDENVESNNKNANKNEEDQDGISIDDDDNEDGDSDIEFTPTDDKSEQSDQNENGKYNENNDMDTNYNKTNNSNDNYGESTIINDNDQQSKFDRKEKISILRKNYQAFVEQQKKDADENDGDEDHESKSSVTTTTTKTSDLKSKTELYHHLKSGFDYVRKCKIDETCSVMTSKSSLKIKNGSQKDKKQHEQQQQQQSTALRDHQFVQTFYQSPIIRFVDPTSGNNGVAAAATTTTTTTTTDSQEKTPSPSSRKAWNRLSTKPAFHKLHIFNKIKTLLVNNHNSSLKNIKYKNLRTNGIEVIENIPIRPMLNTDNISDPADWHKGPLCHVYIAACASMDHYRVKVRPFLRAFVSQIDGAGSGNKDSASTAAKKAMKKEYHQKDKNTSKEKSRAIKKEQVAKASLAAAQAKDAAGSSASSKYMIIYVPIHPSSIEPISGVQVKDKKKSSGGGFFGMNRGGNRTSDRNSDSQSVKSGISNEWSFEDDTPAVAADEQQLNPAIIRKLTKEQKEIFNKFCRDFPNAKTCLLSSLLDKDYELAAESDVQNQEIHEFLQALGKVMISGFTDRVQSYNHEISRCKEKVSESKENFDWCRYFLVKESLALTYEQLELPQEALKEYQELELMLPSVAWPDEKDIATQYNELSKASAIGDVEVFRDILHSTKEIWHLSYFSYKYLFARQGRLYLLLKQPVSLIDKFIEYIRRVHFLRCSQFENAQEQDRALGLTRVEAWVLSVCWEMKSALQTYFPFSLVSDQEVSNLDEEERKCIESLIELLNFARMSLKNLGDLLYTTNNTISQAISGRPSDCKIPWVPWSDLSKGVKPKRNLSKEIAGNQNIIQDLGQESNAATPWIRNILKSCNGYDNVFLELSNMLIRLNTLVDRMRCAARLSAEQAECHIIRGDFDKATAKLLPTIDLCMSEPWDTLLSWRLFRLICCQRISGNPPEYLRSLTACFEERCAKAMPPKLINLLIADLEAVVSSSDISGHTWGLSPFLGVDLLIKPTKGGEILESSNVLRKNVVKNVCYVGEEVITVLNLFSTLPKSITVELKVQLLKLDDYTVQHKTGLTEQNEDKITLDLGSSVKIEPGKNDYQLPWTVMTVGQYAIASIEIQWKNAFFMQDYCIPRYPALCFDVLPNEPTQSIELDPIFLIPGHIQNVRLYFFAGSDIVSGGLIELFCSSGVKVLAPGAEVESGQWESNCSITLDPCQPGEKITAIVTVKCDAIDSYNANAACKDEQLLRPEMSQTLQAIVRTKYHHKLYAKLLEMSTMTECAPMSAILQAKVTTLERPALTISNSFANIYDNNNVIVNAIVNCNTPVPFRLKEWNVMFPSPLKLDDDGDLNGGLFDCSVIEGEELFFGFKCHVQFSDNTSNKHESALLNIVLQDHFGKTFLQVLPLDLDSFYKKLSKESNKRHTNTITAQFSLASNCALVGQPVSIRCNIDCSSLPQQERCLIYSINSDVGGDWVIGGMVRGKLKYEMDSNQCSVEFTGIPTRSGIIKSFPTINITCASSPPYSVGSINVLQEFPTLFTSLSHKNIETFAFMMPEDL